MGKERPSLPFSTTSSHFLEFLESKKITFQLLSKDSLSLGDAEVLSGRWHAYVEGFASDAGTPGRTHKKSPPLIPKKVG
jgi:hypothetical protein